MLVGFLTIGVTAVWVIVDAFLIPGMVRDHNLKLASMLRPVARSVAAAA